MGIKTMDASKVRNSFARILERVRDRGESVIIARYGQPVAALVPVGQPSDGSAAGNGGTRAAAGGRSSSRRRP